MPIEIDIAHVARLARLGLGEDEMARLADELGLEVVTVLPSGVLGRFDYRNHLIGKKTLTLPQVRFGPSSARIRKSSFPALKGLARLVAQNPQLVLHIVAYQKNNRTLAEKRAKSIKKYLLDQERKIDPSRIKVSWFDQPETVSAGRKTHRLDSSVNFFSQSS